MLSRLRILKLSSSRDFTPSLLPSGAPRRASMSVITEMAPSSNTLS